MLFTTLLLACFDDTESVYVTRTVQLANAKVIERSKYFENLENDGKEYYEKNKECTTPLRMCKNTHIGIRQIHGSCMNEKQLNALEEQFKSLFYDLSAPISLEIQHLLTNNQLHKRTVNMPYVRAVLFIALGLFLMLILPVALTTWGVTKSHLNGQSHLKCPDVVKYELNCNGDRYWSYRDFCSDYNKNHPRIRGSGVTEAQLATCGQFQEALYKNRALLIVGSIFGSLLFIIGGAITKLAFNYVEVSKNPPNLVSVRVFTPPQVDGVVNSLNVERNDVEEQSQSQA